MRWHIPNWYNIQNNVSQKDLTDVSVDLNYDNKKAIIAHNVSHGISLDNPFHIKLPYDSKHPWGINLEDKLFNKAIENL